MSVGQAPGPCRRDAVNDNLSGSPEPAEMLQGFGLWGFGGLRVYVQVYGLGV